MTNNLLKCPACFQDSPHLAWDFEGNRTEYLYYLKSVHRNRQNWIARHVYNLGDTIRSAYKEGKGELLCLWCIKYYKWYKSDGSSKYIRHIASYFSIYKALRRSIIE